MQNYWFLYHLSDGTLYGSPYRGDADEWTNVPDGCGVIGPLPNHATAKDAFSNPDCYTTTNGELVPLPNIEAIKAAKAEAALKKTPEQKEIDKLKAEKEQLNLSVIELWENIIPLLP